MAKTREIDAVVVRKINNGAYEISSLYGGYYRHKLYIGYTQTEATKRFKQALRNGTI